MKRAPAPPPESSDWTETDWLIWSSDTAPAKPKAPRVRTPAPAYDPRDVVQPGGDVHYDAPAVMVDVTVIARIAFTALVATLAVAAGEVMPALGLGVAIAGTAVFVATWASGWKEPASFGAAIQVPASVIMLGLLAYAWGLVIVQQCSLLAVVAGRCGG